MIMYVGHSKTLILQRSEEALDIIHGISPMGMGTAYKKNHDEYSEQVSKNFKINF